MPQRIYTATLRLSFATKNENKKRLKRAAFAGSHVEQGAVECATILIASSVGQGKSGNGIVGERAREKTPAGAADDYILLSVSPHVSRGYRMRCGAEFICPQFFTRLYVESSESRVVRRSDKNQTAGRRYRAAEHGSAGVLFTGRSVVGHTDRYLPDHICRIDVDGRHRPPRGLLAHHIRLTFLEAICRGTS
jgi:hypothetical protein